jgi:hypothetical protein
VVTINPEVPIRVGDVAVDPLSAGSDEPWLPGSPAGGTALPGRPRPSSRSPGLPQAEVPAREGPGRRDRAGQRGGVDRAGAGVARPTRPRDGAPFRSGRGPGAPGSLTRTPRICLTAGARGG